MSSASDLRPGLQCHSWLARSRNWRWAWLMIMVLALLENFFVRQLLSALFLFTVVFVIAAAVAALFIGIVTEISVRSYKAFGEWRG
ncbi:MAG: hypothetical protein ACRD4X_09475 [Candidatus Acidiferrales bacterium]